MTALSEQLPSVVHRLRAGGCVFAEEEAELLLDTATDRDGLDLLVRRRVSGLPLEHVLGWARFCGLRIKVGRGVFVPRRRTEFLVRHAAALAPAGCTVVDLCCGSGAVGAALAVAVAPRELYAGDVDPAAVRCATRNLAPVGGRVGQGDLYDALPRRLRGRIDVLVANVPYVPSAEVDLLPVEARTHEPRATLDGGPDGLDVLRRVAAAAPHWLAPGGHLLVETSAWQAPGAGRVFTAAGLAAAFAHDPDLDATVVSGRHPTAGRLTP